MPRQQRISWASWLAVLIVMYGVYLLFASTLSKPELFAGTVAAAISTVAAGTFGLIGTVKFRPRIGDLFQAWRIPWYMIEGTYEILKALASQLFTRKGADSLVRAVRFEMGGDDPQSIARRALAVVYTTMTPNFIVLGIIPRQRLLLYHQVLAGDVLQMTINLGAEP